MTIYTDGACEGNPGPGGWAAILEYHGHCRELAGSAPATTNNRMELQAAIEALSALREPCVVRLFTDSEYLRDGITSWISRWKLNGWRTVDRKPVKNGDLWRALDEAAAPHQIQWHWLKGHAGHPRNEQCDQLARAETDRLRHQYTPGQLASELALFKSREPLDTNPLPLLGKLDVPGSRTRP